jgi:hypothetical protein
VIHYLKTWTQYFDRIVSGEKNFEVRKNDRDFQVNDVLVLKEWYPNLQKYSGNQETVIVTYILHGPEFGIEDGHCVMSIKPYTII